MHLVIYLEPQLHIRQFLIGPVILPPLARGRVSVTFGCMICATPVLLGWYQAVSV